MQAVNGAEQRASMFASAEAARLCLGSSSTRNPDTEACLRISAGASGKY